MGRQSKYPGDLCYTVAKRGVAVSSACHCEIYRFGPLCNCCNHHEFEMTGKPRLDHAQNDVTEILQMGSQAGFAFSSPAQQSIVLYALGSSMAICCFPQDVGTPVHQPFVSCMPLTGLQYIQGVRCHVMVSL